MLQQQHCRSIYDALDTFNHRVALQHCDALLRNPQAASAHTLARTLKALSLLRLSKRSDAADEVETVCSSKDSRSLSEVAVLGPLTFVLSRLGKHWKAAEILETASKAAASDLEIAKLAFKAHLTNRDYLKAQQAAARSQKAVSQKSALPTKATRTKGSSEAAVSDCSSVRNRYFWWSVQSYLLLATETPQVSGAALALNLAERMVEKHIATEDGKFDRNSDEDIGLYIQVLLQQSRRGKDEQSRARKRQQALELLITGPGLEISKRSLSLGQLKLQLLKDSERWKDLQHEARTMLDAGERNWMTIEKWIEAETGAARQDSQMALAAVEYAKSLATRDNGRREYLLAQLFLHHELRNAQCDQLGSSAYVLLIAEYFSTFSTKMCCFEDLVPLVDALSHEEKGELANTNDLSKLDFASSPGFVPTFDTEKDVIKAVNVVKLRSRILTPGARSQEDRGDLVRRLLLAFYASLPCSSQVSKTVPRPGTDFVLLAAQYVLASNSSAPSTLVLLLSVLSHAAQASPASYAFRLLSLRIYLQLGCPTIARALWKELKIRGIQNESLGWLWMQGFSTLQEHEGGADHNDGPANGTTSRTNPFSDWRKEAEELYAEAETEGPTMMMQAFDRGNYSTIKEFVTFNDCLDRSAQRLRLRLEAARSEALILAEADVDAARARKNIIEPVLNDVAVKAEKGLKTQWDFSVLPSFAHPSLPTLVSLTGRETTAHGENTLTISAEHLAALGFCGSEMVEIALPAYFEAVILGLKTGCKGQQASSSAPHIEAEALFAICLRSVRTSGSLESDGIQQTIASLLACVEKYFASQPTPLPADEARLVELLLSLYVVLKARYPENISAGSLSSSSSSSKVRESLRSALQQIATTLRQRSPASILEASAFSSSAFWNDLLRDTLESQRGGLGAREKVTKNVKEEAGKRRKKLAQKIFETLR